MSVAALNVDLSLQSAKFQDGINKAKKSLTEFEKSAKKVGRDLEKFGKTVNKVGSSLTSNLTLPILAVGAAIGVALKKTADYGDELVNMSNRTGASLKMLQELKFHGSQVGVAMEDIQGALMKLSKSMGDAATGTKESQQAFAHLGISLKDSNGNLKTSSDMFKEVVGQLSRVKNETTRNAIGMDLFGKGFTNIIPIIQEGKEGLAKYADEAAKAGLIMSDEAVIGADNFGDAMDKLKQQFEAVGMKLATAFMPIVQRMASFLETSVLPAIRGVADWFKNLSPTMQGVIIGVTALVAALGPALMVFGSMASGLGSIIAMAPKVAAAFTMMAGPLGIITLAIAGITALLMWQPSTAVDNVSKQFVEQSVVVSNLQKKYDELTKTQGKQYSSLSELNAAIAAGTDVVTASDVEIQKLGDSLDREKKFLNELKAQLTPVTALHTELKAEAKELDVTLGGAVETFTSYSGGIGKSAEELKKMRDHVGLLSPAFNKGTQELMQLGDEFFVAGGAAIASGIKVGSFANQLAFLDHANPVLAEIKTKFEEIDFAADLFGKTDLETVTAKIDFLKNKLIEMKMAGVDPLDPAFQKIKATIDTLSLSTDAWKMKITTALNEISKVIGITTEAITGFVSAGLENQTIALDNYYKTNSAMIAESTASEYEKAEKMKRLDEKVAAKKKELMIKQAKLTKATAMMSAIVNTAQAVTSALTIAPPFGEVLAVIVAALGAAQIATIASQPLPMAAGGLAFGESLALVGEGRGTSKSNPEVIAPLDKLLSYLQPQGEMGGQVEFIISGENLRAIQNRNQRFRQYGSGQK